MYLNSNLVNKNLMNTQMNNYIAPELQVMELETESVLCTSGQFESWKNEELDWD